MKANAKYTAKEIVEAAGFEDVQFGKIRVRIGGLTGIVKPDHTIRIPAGSEKISVLVGIETKELVFEGDNEDFVISESAKEKVEAEGKEDSERAEEIKAAKAEAKKEKPVK